MFREGLKVNTTKHSFGLKDITYLSYRITRGFKTNPRKVQGIVDIILTTNKTEALAITGMVQYYRYMLSRWYHMSAPQTEAVSGSKGGKYFGTTI